MLQKIVSGYDHADLMLTIAMFALIYFAWRATTVDLSSFGMGIAAIFGGRGAHAWGTSQGVGA